jgi:hypothetical protein
MSVVRVTVLGMARPLSSVPTWSDSQLREAVAVSSNWRQVMRALGLNANSAGTIRRVKRQALGLGCETSHFRGKRAWSDAQLRRAVIESLSWNEVLVALGLAVGSSDGRTRIKAHALRLGLDVTHLEGPAVKSEVPRFTPDLKHLRDAATSIAAAWFSMSGYSSALIMDGDLNMYLIPSGVIAGRVQILLRTYKRFVVANASGLITPKAA